MVHFLLWVCYNGRYREAAEGGNRMIELKFNVSDVDFDSVIQAQATVLRG